MMLLLNEQNFRPFDAAWVPQSTRLVPATSLVFSKWLAER
jgi:hypothetical protein